MCCFYNSLFIVAGDINITHSRNRIGNRNFNQKKLPIIVFQINSISLIESEKIRETSNKNHNLCCMFQSVLLDVSRKRPEDQVKYQATNQTPKENPVKHIGRKILKEKKTMFLNCALIDCCLWENKKMNLTE